MLTIAICDDEKYYRDQIHGLLLSYLEAHDLEASVDLFCSGKEFLAPFHQLPLPPVVPGSTTAFILGPSRMSTEQ